MRNPPKAQSTPRKSVRPENVRGDTKVLKKRAANALTATPRKRPQDQKSLQPPELRTISEEEPTPACVRLALGPTPQKDGAILGIFDMLPVGTPSRGATGPTIAIGAVVGTTPSKAGAPQTSEPTISRTPQSSGKRFFLEAYAGTPLKRKRDEESYTPSTAKRQYATPSFLRRNFPLARIDEDSQDTALAAPPFKKRGVVRSLSSIIQGLKKHEEEKMDDDWDIMKELEADERSDTERPSVPKVLVEDSQAIEMPLGPDKGAELNDDASVDDQGAFDANGKPRKVWKKKGLKRQTRRVIMRPVIQKPKKATKAAHSDSEDSESEAAVEEDPQGQDLSEGEGDDVSELEAGDSDSKHDSQQSRHEPSVRKPKKLKKGKREDEKRKGKEAGADDEDTGKKPKKVSAQAHANFRRLKIKSKNSKANGRAGKFGRR